MKIKGLLLFMGQGDPRKSQQALRYHCLFFNSTQSPPYLSLCSLYNYTFQLLSSLSLIYYSIFVLLIILLPYIPLPLSHTTAVRMSEKKNHNRMSFVDKKFIKSKAIRRNKNIFDIQYIDRYENIEQKRRRTPYHSSLATDIDERFNQSFMNSTEINSFKLDNEIEKHKSKVTYSHNPSRRNTTELYYIDGLDNIYVSSQKVKGVSMQKMLTRQYRESFNKNLTNNEIRFNNFALSPPNRQKTRHFDKYVSRESLEKLRAETSPDIDNSKVPQIYQKLNYPSNLFKVNWEYKKQKWDRGPTFFKITKDNSVNLQEIAFEKLEKAKRSTQTNWNKKLSHFLSQSSKEEASQFERIFYPPNMNFRGKKKVSASTSRPFRVKSVKKYEQFERWQLCDAKYFVLNPEKGQKALRLYTEGN